MNLGSLEKAEHLFNHFGITKEKIFNKITKDFSNDNLLKKIF